MEEITLDSKFDETVWNKRNLEFSNKRAKMFERNFHSLQPISQFMNVDLAIRFEQFSATVFLNNSFHYFRKRK